MRRLLRVSRLIDRLADALGAVTSVLTLVMVLIGAFNAVTRYLDRDFKLELSSNSYIELQWYLFSIIFLLGASHALRRGSHVRVDVFYGRLSRRAKAWLDLVGGVIFLVPTCIAAAWLSWPAARHSWQIREQSPDPGGLPRYPIKLLVVVAFTLLLIQAVSEVIKRAAVLAGHEVDGGPRTAKPQDGSEA